ncbi:hypothetical protein KHQ81_06730 [Mycoplasmatota bacterium]|nr:hypothetical protein KHQ81_06730 [Mycoplasmatota bacterium]
MARRKKSAQFFSHGTMFGSCLAMVISYGEHHHIAWAIFHGLLNWLYVIYYTIFYVIF